MIKDEHDYITRAFKSYDNPSCVSIEEFEKDLYLITNIKKTVRKYCNNEEVNVRRFVNYFVTLYNCFGNTATDMLNYKIVDDEYRAVIQPIIVYLGYDANLITTENVNLKIIDDLFHL